MAIMAATLIPLAGMIGGGLDLSRMYIVKTRLQHACDAGALAGRKAMGAGTWAQSSYMPNATAERFFKANYAVGSYGSSELTYAFTENAGRVTGTASAKIPLTLTKVLFGAVWSAANSIQTLSVTCATEMRLPNTDVMFVLDTTGSMGDTPFGDTQPKLASLKESVKCFYEIVARLNTDADCTTGTPSGGTGTQVQIRFGFVPYSTNVNVGYLLKPDWLANSWKYQSREAMYKNAYDWVVVGSPQSRTENVSINNVAYSNCNDDAARTLNTSSTGYSNSNQNKSVTDVTYDAQSWSSNNNGTCSGTKTTTTTNYVWKQGSTAFDKWHYGLINQNISGLKNGSSWNTSFTLPIGTNGSAKTLVWGGCVEERRTVKASTYWPLPADADDLDIDAIPSAGDPNSLWGPVLPGMIYTRNAPTNAISNWTTADSYTTADYGNGSTYVCPTAAKKLQQWPDPDPFDTYVDSLAANGNTYHDIGLIWGARLMSPTGLFADENDFTPQGGEIQRNLIFMTDGDPCTSVGNYQAYGVAWFDRRQTDASVAPTEGCTTTGTLTAQVNARVDAICSAIKNKNITLWVVSFGALASATQTRLTACASSGKYFTATNRATLQQTFKSIADQISMLRLTK
jgi:Flp pilus assembly protein TadG